jgi:hypothetical protein
MEITVGGIAFSSFILAHSLVYDVLIACPGAVGTKVAKYYPWAFLGINESI